MIYCYDFRVLKQVILPPPKQLYLRFYYTRKLQGRAIPRSSSVASQFAMGYTLRRFDAGWSFTKVCFTNVYSSLCDGTEWIKSGPQWDSLIKCDATPVLHVSKTLRWANSSSYSFDLSMAFFHKNLAENLKWPLIGRSENLLTTGRTKTCVPVCVFVISLFRR